MTDLKFSTMISWTLPIVFSNLPGERLTQFHQNSLEKVNTCWHVAVISRACVRDDAARAVQSSRLEQWIVEKKSRINEKRKAHRTSSQNSQSRR